jgi:hypothetical protein
VRPVVNDRIIKIIEKIIEIIEKKNNGGFESLKTLSLPP